MSGDGDLVLPNGQPLRPGDVLLYGPSGVFGTLITVKTWAKVAHCELWLGDGVVYASRDPKRWLPWPSGGGVDFYPFRQSELVRVRRTKTPEKLDLAALEAFCRETRGQAYDWWGLLRFFNIGEGKQDRMFCSEAVARALKKAGVPAFDPAVDCDQVSPGMLDWTPALETIWSADDEAAGTMSLEVQPA